MGRLGMDAESALTELNSKQRFDMLTRKSAFWIALAVSPVFFLFAALGDSGRGRAAALCAFVVVSCARLFWDRSEHVWFWLTLAMTVACHVPLILLIPWTDKSYPGVVLLPAGLLDFAIVYRTFKAIDKIANRKRAE